MEAVLVGDGRIGFRVTLANALSSLLTISSGGSIGREGAMVQLAAMLGSRLGLLARAPIPRLRLMVACGGAAGIAAAYNAPISGALFVAEIVLGSIAMESFGPLIVASVCSSATIHQFLGYGPTYDVPHVQFLSNWELIFYAVLGVVLGHLAPPFLALLDFAKSCFARLRLPPYWQLGIGGLVVGVISIFVPQVWGNGYSVVGSILHGQLVGVWLLSVLVAKVVGDLRDRRFARGRRRVHADAVHRLRRRRAVRRPAAPGAAALHLPAGRLRARRHGRLPGGDHPCTAHLDPHAVRDDRRLPDRHAADAHLRGRALHRQGLPRRRIHLSRLAHPGIHRPGRR